MALLSAELAAVRAEQLHDPRASLEVLAAASPEARPVARPGSQRDPEPRDPEPRDPKPRDPEPRGPDQGWSWDQHTRVRAIHDPPAPPSPHPGRHAARAERLIAWLPVRGGVALQPAHLAVVAMLVALGLGWTTWWVVSSEPRTSPVPTLAGDPSPVAAPVPPATAAAPVAPSSGPLATGPGVPAGPGSDGRAAGPTSGEVVVDVAGKVRRPGLVVLPAGSRVADALEQAGGARDGVDLVSLNLARVLVDGEQLLVGVRAPAGAGVPVAPPPGGSAAGAPVGLVNLNTADEALLDTLPGVGPVTAAAIVAWRAEHGGFTAVDELLEVNGIGEVTLAELAPLVTV